jgi:sugar diacid utilization regulator
VPTIDSGMSRWLTKVAGAAARDADVPRHLLGQHLEMLAGAAIDGRRPDDHALSLVVGLGEQAARDGVTAEQVVRLYLSAAWRLWRDMPIDVRAGDASTMHASAGALLRATAEAVAALVDGHQSARRDLIRREESLRREFVDDLLRGEASVARIVERAEPFGLNLAGSHVVAYAGATDDSVLAETVESALERRIVQRFGDRDVLVATKEGRLVVILPGSTDDERPHRAPDDRGRQVLDALDGLVNGSWLVGLGRSYPGAYGVCRSYEEAREAFELGQRRGLTSGVARASDILVYRVVLRDTDAISDLVESLLSPLSRARGGAEPLIATLGAYFAAGGVATEAAKLLNISVRSVTYRLARVKELTGHDPADPDHRFALQTAVLGAQLLAQPSRV